MHSFGLLPSGSEESITQQFLNFVARQNSVNEQPYTSEQRSDPVNRGTYQSMDFAGNKQVVREDESCISDDDLSREFLPKQEIARVSSRKKFVDSKVNSLISTPASRASSSLIPNSDHAIELWEGLPICVKNIIKVLHVEVSLINNELD